MSKFFKNLIKDCDWSLCWPLTNEDTFRILNLQLKLEGFFSDILKTSNKIEYSELLIKLVQNGKFDWSTNRKPLNQQKQDIFFENWVLFFFFFDIFVVISQGCAFLYLTGINDSISSLEVDATYWLITHHHFLWFLM